MVGRLPRYGRTNRRRSGEKVGHAFAGQPHAFRVVGTIQAQRLWITERGQQVAIGVQIGYARDPSSPPASSDKSVSCRIVFQ